MDTLRFGYLCAVYLISLLKKRQKKIFLIDFFCKYQWFVTNKVSGLFGIEFTDLNMNLSNDCIHHSMQCMVLETESEEKWRA